MEILQKQFRTYVFLARVLKDNKQPSWPAYVFNAKHTLDNINKINSSQEITKTISYGKIIFLDKFKKVA